MWEDFLSSCPLRKPNFVHRFFDTDFTDRKICGDDHFSCPDVTVEIERTNFLNPECRETLYFLRAGFATKPCHHGSRTVVFDSRSKTPVHFSPFIRQRRTSIVSVALSRPDASRIGRWALPTTHCPATAGQEFGLSSPPRKCGAKRSSAMNKTVAI